MDRSKPNSRRPPRAAGSMSPLEALELGTRHPNEGRPVDLPLAQIVVDEQIQVRVDGLDEERVEQYTIVVENGGEMEPIIIFQDADGTYLLADGFHRVAAYRLAGRETIKARISKGGYDAAYEYAENANLEHGLAYSNEDKRNILKRRITQGRTWFEWVGDGKLNPRVSYNEMARQLGVSQPTITSWVNGIVNELSQSTSKNLEVDRSQVVGKDGKKRDVSRIGSATASKPKVERPRQPVEPETIEDFEDEKFSTSTHMVINAGGESRLVEKRPVDRPATPTSRNPDKELAVQMESDIAEVVSLLTRYDPTQVNVLWLLGKSRVEYLKAQLGQLEIWAQEMGDFLSSISTPPDQPKV
ncbi:MAG: ParB N-terminal domain-containing protein [Chloroflexi bacterium]|nr:ParB N-terminal domain-containing protein [Chloroflexota bacterium]